LILFYDLTAPFGNQYNNYLQLQKVVIFKKLKTLLKYGIISKISSYSTVSSVLCKISWHLNTNKALQRRIYQIEYLLIKSQKQT